MAESLGDRLDPAETIAGGGSVKGISSDTSRGFFLPWISVEDAGVGGRPTRGIASLMVRVCAFYLCSRVLKQIGRKTWSHKQGRWSKNVGKARCWLEVLKVKGIHGQEGEAVFLLFIVGDKSILGSF